MRPLQITTTNQTTAEVGQEPLRELRSFRSGALLNWLPEPWWRNEVYLGWHTVRLGIRCIFSDLTVHEGSYAVVLMSS